MDFSDENEITSSVEIAEKAQEEQQQLEASLRRQVELAREQVLNIHNLAGILESQAQERREITSQLKRDISRERSLAQSIIRDAAEQWEEVLLLRDERDKIWQKWAVIEEILQSKLRRLEELRLGGPATSVQHLLAEEQRLLNVIEAEERRRGMNEGHPQSALYSFLTTAGSSVGNVPVPGLPLARFTVPAGHWEGVPLAGSADPHDT